MRSIRGRATHCLSALDTDDFCTHISQHHRSERAGADPCNFNNPISG
jgi:hypothetical protein